MKNFYIGGVSVGRPVVSRKKNNLGPPRLNSYGSVERTTGIALQQDRRERVDCVGMDGSWMDAAAARDTFPSLSPSPFLSGDIIKR